MNLIVKILVSRTFLAALSMFILGGVEATSTLMPHGFYLFISGILTMMITYFHANPTTTYNLPKDGSSVHNPVDVSDQLG
jgi:hypothetical protein